MDKLFKFTLGVLSIRKVKFGFNNFSLSINFVKAYKLEILSFVSILKGVFRLSNNSKIFEFLRMLREKITEYLIYLSTWGNKTLIIRSLKSHLCVFSNHLLYLTLCLLLKKSQNIFR